MKPFPPRFTLRHVVLMAACVATMPVMAVAGMMEDVASLQTGWAGTNYQLKGDYQTKSFQTLSDRGDALVAKYPDAAEARIWNGIIKSSLAGAKGGLGALSLAKAARAELEKALRLDDQALAGSAYTSLGTLYFKVPGWPIGFGDDHKAEQLLLKALRINPEGIDPNYFYAEFLRDQGNVARARVHLLRAQKAAPRPGRELADQGRQAEIAAALRALDAR